MDAHAIRGILVEEFVANGLTANEISNKYQVPINLVIDYIKAYHENSPVLLKLEHKQTSTTFREFLDSNARHYLETALSTNKNIAEAARFSGVSRSHFYSLLNEYNLLNNTRRASKVTNKRSKKMDVYSKGKSRANTNTRAI